MVFIYTTVNPTFQPMLNISVLLVFFKKLFKQVLLDLRPKNINILKIYRIYSTTQQHIVAAGYPIYDQRE